MPLQTLIHGVQTGMVTWALAVAGQGPMMVMGDAVMQGTEHHAVSVRNLSLDDTAHRTLKM